MLRQTAAMTSDRDIQRWSEYQHNHGRTAGMYIHWVLYNVDDKESQILTPPAIPEANKAIIYNLWFSMK